MTTMREIGEGIWTAELPLKMGLLDIGTRTTVVRLADGGLWVHSPGRLDPALRGEVEALGPVRHLVAPNRFHHLFLRDWKDAFPDGQVHGAPGLAAKRKSFHFDAELGDEPPAAWRGVLDQALLRGAPVMSEVVFFHAPSRTFLGTDLCMNIQQASNWATRAFWRLNGGFRGLRPSRMVRFTVKDRAAARASIDRMLAWDFDRVLIAHGAPVERGGREALRDAYAWL